MSAATASEGDRGDLSRRTFLAGGGVLLGSALLVGPGSATLPGPLRRFAAGGGRPLALGYVVDSDGATIEEAHALVRTAGTRVRPAISVGAGGHRFTDRSATVRVDGLTPGLGDGARPELQTAYLDALVAPPRGAGDEPLPFYAWTLDRRGGSASSHSTSFTTPVASEPTIGFALRLGTAGADGARQWSDSAAILTAGSHRGLARLRPGTYLLGLDPGAWGVSRRLPGDDEGAWGPLASLAVTIRTA